MTPNNVSSFQNKGWGYIYDGFQTNGSYLATIGIPETTGPWQVFPANYTMNRYSLALFAQKTQWEIAFEKQTFQLFGDWAQTQMGAAAHHPGSTGWPIANGMYDGPTFNMGIHRINLNEGFYDIIGGNNQCTYRYQSNIWYVIQAVINARNGYDTPQNPLDNAYFNAFLNDMGNYCRPNGFMQFLYSGITSSQAGALQGNFFKYAGGDGQDWTALFSGMMGYDHRKSWAWFSTSDISYYADALLDTRNAIIGAHDTTYWQSVVSNNGDLYTPCCAVPSAWDLSTGAPGPQTGMTLPILNAMGATTSKLNTLRDWANNLAAGGNYFNNYDFTAALADGTEGDRADLGSCSGCGSAGPITVTFSTCPGPQSINGVSRSWVLTGSSTALPFWGYPTGGTCASAGGGSGTVTFTIDHALTGTFKATLGCSRTANPYPNELNNNFDIPWYKCKSSFH